ncbi:MAG: replication-associated recombination protein A [Actinomycetota bacterium]|nr:replication-associated recombination protein A [Actinomycetota bacterium]
MDRLIQNKDELLTENSAMYTPLAERMRPRSLEEFVGQEHLLGKDGLLRDIIASDKLSSMILWGPPGSGKTTIARIIASTTKAHFVEFSAVTSGISDIRRVVKEATDRRTLEGKQTILFVDEIHRFNKAQQDAFLPHIEAGTIILIGATTENPGFEVNAPVLSRARLFRLEQLSDKDIVEILRRAISDKERGLGNLNLAVDDDALGHIAKNANGDARVALTALEIAANSVLTDGTASAISLSMAEKAINKKQLQYDRAGDSHYDIISAFIKSMRGSDPDAAVYYLARMLESGEDPKFIARRMVIFASEDIGNADPHALLVATATVDALNFVGLPEAKITLSQCATYLASAPKSNAAKTAIFEAIADIQNERIEPIPNHLRNAPTTLAKKLGHGKGYKYPHNYPKNYVEETYLPEGLKGKIYYRPTENGYEKTIKERLNSLRKKKV